MKTLFFNYIILVMAFFAITKNASAQPWFNDSPNNFLLTGSYVGIGNTTTPTAQLNVSSGSSNNGIRINQTGTTAASLSLQAATGKQWALFSTGIDNVAQGPGHLTFYDWSEGVERMRISSGGAVSISTDKTPASVGTNNTSAYRLFVQGGILTDELLVQTGWADYVFRKNYALPTLFDVEKHIAEKGHLPNVPSEKEVEENGLNVGKMAVTQQEKIEELFLYVIQLNKDVQTLRAENESLRQILNTQKPNSDEK